MSGDLSQFSMSELFRVEAETQTSILTSNLLALEKEGSSPAGLEALMRAAHSLKGAARMVELNAAVRVSHVMEDCFVAAQKGTLVLQPKQIDLLLAGVDLLARIANTPEAEAATWEGADKAKEIQDFVSA